jgi:hypothetical protein
MDGRTEDPTQFETLRRANKYRRAFTWRVGQGNSESRAETTGLVHLATSDYPDILEDYLYISRRRYNNKTAIAKLQLQYVKLATGWRGAVLAMIASPNRSSVLML